MGFLNFLDSGSTLIPSICNFTTSNPQNKIYSDLRLQKIFVLTYNNTSSKSFNNLRKKEITQTQCNAVRIIVKWSYAKTNQTMEKFLDNIYIRKLGLEYSK